MSERVTRDCDRCNSEIKAWTHNSRFALNVDDQMDASGNGRDYETEYVDLCPKCAYEVLGSLIPVIGKGHYNYPLNKQIAQVLRGKAKASTLEAA